MTIGLTRLTYDKKIKECVAKHIMMAEQDKLGLIMASKHYVKCLGDLVRPQGANRGPTLLN